MTHTLAILEKHNLVEMKPNPKDGRSKNVWITAKGRDFRDHAIGGMDLDIEHLSGLLAGTDVAALTEQLATVRKIMDVSRDETE